MASPQAEALHDAMRKMRDQIVDSEHVPTLEQQRSALEAVREMGADPGGVSVTETYAGGCRAYWYDAEGGAVDAAVLYLHGGGYVIGSPYTHEFLTKHLARAAGCRVLSLDYRLAPEHRHPAAVDDAVAAYRWLLDEAGLPAERIAIGGDSAGGGLTVAALVAIRDAGLPQPAGAVPLSPWVDLEGTGESLDTNADKDFLVGRDGLAQMAPLYADDLRAPTASPLHADLTGLAPMLVQVGGDETLLDDSRRLASRAEQAGVDVTLEVFDEMQHVFQTAAGNVPEADDAVARLGSWLRERLGLR